MVTASISTYAILDHMMLLWCSLMAYFGIRWQQHTSSMRRHHQSSEFFPLDFAVPHDFIYVVGTPVMKGTQNPLLPATHHNIIHGFIGNLKYIFQLDVKHTRENMIADPVITELLGIIEL